jgi:hypothetical protein
MKPLNEEMVNVIIENAHAHRHPHVVEEFIIYYFKYVFPAIKYDSPYSYLEKTYGDQLDFEVLQNYPSEDEEIPNLVEFCK